MDATFPDSSGSVKRVCVDGLAVAVPLGMVPMELMSMRSVPVPVAAMPSIFSLQSLRPPRRLRFRPLPGRADEEVLP